MFAPDGMIRGNYQAWRDYLARDFHPSRHDATLCGQWLRDNTAQFTVVGQTA